MKSFSVFFLLVFTNWKIGNKSVSAKLCDQESSEFGIRMPDEIFIRLLCILHYCIVAYLLVRHNRINAPPQKHYFCRWRMLGLCSYTNFQLKTTFHMQHVAILKKNSKNENRIAEKTVTENKSKEKRKCERANEHNAPNEITTWRETFPFA